MDFYTAQPKGVVTPAPKSFSIERKHGNLFHLPSNVAGCCHASCQPFFNDNPRRGADESRTALLSIGNTSTFTRGGGPPAHFDEAGIAMPRPCTQPPPDLLRIPKEQREAAKRTWFAIYAECTGDPSIPYSQASYKAVAAVITKQLRPEPSPSCRKTVQHNRQKRLPAEDPADPIEESSPSLKRKACKQRPPPAEDPDDPIEESSPSSKRKASEQKPPLLEDPNDPIEESSQFQSSRFMRWYDKSKQPSSQHSPEPSRLTRGSRQSRAAHGECCYSRCKLATSEEPLLLCRHSKCPLYLHTACFLLEFECLPTLTDPSKVYCMRHAQECEDCDIRDRAWGS